jgi:hypothetical protein
LSTNFVQTITFHCDHPEEIVAMLAEWDQRQASADVMGYIGTKMMADREHLGRYVIVAEFAVVEPGVSAAEEAQRNNRREETRAFAERMRALVDVEPEWHHFDEIYKTDW